MTEREGLDVGNGRQSLESISEGLAKFYRKRQPKLKQVTVHDTTDLTSGWETELYGFTLKYCEGHRSTLRRLVARLYPGRNAAEKAKHEFSVIRRLGEVGYPVPSVHEVEVDLEALGVPFITMDLIEGHSMMDDFLGTPVKELGASLEVFTSLFVELHRIDPAMVFPELPRFVDTSDYLDLALERTRRGLEERGPSWLEPVLDWLEESKIGVSPGRFSVLHRDFHPANIMVRLDGSHAVIDWGASSSGDFREDLTWTFMLASAFWGRPLGEAILEAYQRAAEEEISDVGFFEVASIYRRIQDTSISFTSGAEEASMRAGAVEQMREGVAHLHRIHDFLKERTGIRLSEFDEILRTVEE
ncbi:MAG: phosphotransferase [Candidatus Bathyarchaeota archaeon]|nr:MAG: phosphotransferase [Candidatus Bathyarchaeota archaeon]